MPQPKDIDWLNGYKNKTQGFPGGAVVENLPANAGDFITHSVGVLS